MKISAGQRCALGASGVEVPPIVFGTSALANLPDVIPEQRKLAICGEWFRHVEPPVLIDVAYKHGDGVAVDVLGRMLRRLDVTNDEVIIHLTLDSNEAFECWNRSCLLLGDDYRPTLISIDDMNEDAWRAAFELKAAGIVHGVGLGADDVGVQTPLSPQADWVVLRSGFTLMRHSSEVLASLAELAGRQIPIVVRGVFDGGFLVGSNWLDGRVLSAVDPANRSLFAWRTSFVALCHGHGIAPAHACIQFALSGPGVVAVQLDALHPDQVTENVRSVVQKVPASFWVSMKEEGLLSQDYPYLEI